MKFSFRPENNFKFWTGQISSPSFRLGEAIHQEISPYDETKIAVILLDENFDETDDVQYFDTLAEASGYISRNSSADYSIYIGKNAGISSISSTFSGKTNLIKISIPNTTTLLYSSAFKNCTNLKKVEIKSNNISDIPFEAFSGCTSLEEFTMPSVVNIGKKAFLNCSSLTSFTFPRGLASIGQSAFEGCGIQHLNLQIAGISVGESAFNRSGLTSVNLELLGECTVGNGVFANCAGLESVVYSGADISQGMFGYCTSLETVALGTDVYIINSYAFRGCESLGMLNLPSIKRIFSNVLKDSGVSTVLIGSSIENISYDSFSGDSYLTSISIGLQRDSISGAPWGATNAVVNWA